MKLSIAVTTYNRYQPTINCIEKIKDDSRVSDILILDDCSTDGSFDKLVDYYKGNPKVTVMKQMANRGMQQNKFDAISFCQSEWVALFDSDNEFDSTYLDALFFDVSELDQDTIYAPMRALPNFIYDEFANHLITKNNVKEYVPKQFFGALINTCNYVLNKEFYLETYKFNPSVRGVDTANHLYNHLQAGGKFYVVPGMQYQHAISADSEFMKDVHYNMANAMEIEKKLLEL